MTKFERIQRTDMAFLAGLNSAFIQMFLGPYETSTMELYWKNNS